MFIDKFRDSPQRVAQCRFVNVSDAVGVFSGPIDLLHVVRNVDGLRKRIIGSGIQLVRRYSPAPVLQRIIKEEILQRKPLFGYGNRVAAEPGHVASVLGGNHHLVQPDGISGICRLFCILEQFDCGIELIGFCQ